VRVLLDTTFARRAPHSGTAVYVHQLARALAEVPGVTVIEAANAGRRPPGRGGPGSAANLLADLWWTQVTLPCRARAARADVIHHPLPAHAFAAGVPGQVLTVHDLAFERLPHHFATGYRRYAHLAHRAAARQAGAVVCVSRATADDVRSYWRVDPRRIVVAPHGPGQSLAVRPREEPPTHFLYVGDDEPRKNVAGLLEAHRAYARAVADPLPLILAGSVSAGADTPGVRIESHPDPDRLSALHASAAALVHPSVHEGFGLTAIEAMALGTPVIAAASAGVAEVCADAARYTTPGDAGALAGAMTEVAGSRTLREEMSRRGRHRAARFSWQLAARAHLEAYSLAAR
jgi:alpha-1,3-rhamnosyl/mannosyltransferase